MNVLVVVEDDPGMRILIEELLREDQRLALGAPAADIRKAIEAAKAAQPDLIILDHFIEGDIMGLEAAPLLKKAAPAAKIILFTSHDLAIEAEREPAIDAFLRKRHLDQLLPTARALLGLT